MLITFFPSKIKNKKNLIIVIKKKKPVLRRPYWTCARARVMGKAEEVQEKVKADMEAMKEKMATMMEAMMSKFFSFL